MRRMLKAKGLVSLVFCGMMMWSACSTAWINEAEQIITVLIPGIANVVTLVGALQGQTVSADDLQKIQSTGTQAEADLQLIESLMAQYQRADAAAQAGLLSQIQAEVSALQSNLSLLLPALHIKDAATQEKVTAVVRVLLTEVQSVAAIVPRTSGSESAGMTAFGRERAHIKAPLSAKGFVSSYNATMTAKTGDAGLDRVTAGLQIHLHGKFARWASVGLVK